MHSLQDHGIKEAQKQVRCRLKRDGLTAVKLDVTRGSGKLIFNFTGSDVEVAKAKKIIADWN
jgi:hypothetical protein